MSTRPSTPYDRRMIIRRASRPNGERQASCVLDGVPYRIQWPLEVPPGEYRLLLDPETNTAFVCFEEDA